MYDLFLKNGHLEDVNKHIFKIYKNLNIRRPFLKNRSIYKRYY